MDRFAQADGKIVKGKVKELYVFEGLGKKKVTEVKQEISVLW
jgi:GTP-binding protein